MKQFSSKKLNQRYTLGVFQNDNLVFISYSLKEVSNKYNISYDVIYRLIRKSKIFKNNKITVKKLSPTYVKKYYESKFIDFLKGKKDKFYCKSCSSRIKYFTKPLNKHYYIEGNCLKCNNIEKVSCSRINRWFIKNNISLIPLNYKGHNYLKGYIPIPYSLEHKNVIEEAKKEELETIEDEEIKEEDKLKKTSYIIEEAKKEELETIEDEEEFSFFNPIMYWVYFLLIIFSIIFFYRDSEEVTNITDTLKVEKEESVNAIIIDKVVTFNDYKIIYKNEENNIFSVPKALKYWDLKIGDSIKVFFIEYNNNIGIKGRIEFKNIKLKSE